MKKLSKTQAQVLAICWEGKILHFTKTGEFTLSDADHNDYYIRCTTVAVLIGREFIKCSFSPAMDVDHYDITKAGSDYLILHHKDLISHLLPD